MISIFGRVLAKLNMMSFILYVPTSDRKSLRQRKIAKCYFKKINYSYYKLDNENIDNEKCSFSAAALSLYD